MLIVSFFQWWYLRGFKEYLAKFVDTLKNAADFFSIRLLLENFFSPFRQISAGATDSLSLDVRIRAFFDFLVSCIIGATIRFFLLIIGIIVIIVQTLLGLIFALLWPLAPILAVYCAILFLRGVTL